MVKLNEINETALFAWSHDSVPMLATGTLSGVMDDTFSSDSHLSIYSPLSGDDKSNEPIYTASTSGKFSSIDWNNGKDASILACGLENSTIQLYDTNKILNEKPQDLINARIEEYTKHTTPVLQVKFNPLQSHILASSASKGEIFIWDTVKHTAITPGQAISPMGKVSSLAWNNNMAHIFGTAGDNGYGSIWDLKVKREVLQLNYSNINLSTIQWHPTQSTKLVTASDNDSEPVILTWDLRNSSAPEKILKGHKKGILSIDWCLDDPNLLLSSGKDDSTLLWNPIEGIQLASYPSLPNWIHQTKFAPKIPEIFASASLSKKLVIQSLQDTAGPISIDVKTENENDFWNQISTTETQKPVFKVNQAPIWLKRPISAQFGYGGKLAIANKNDIKVVKIANNDKSIDTSAKELVSAIATKDFKPLCELKLSTFSKANDSKDWTLLKKLLSNGTVDSLLDLEKEETTPSDSPISPAADSEIIDDDDFFNQISNGNKSTLTTADVKEYIPEGEFEIDVKDKDDDFEKSAIDLLLTNKTESLIDLCIQKDHIMEALIISLDSSDALKNKVKNAFFQKFADKNSFSRLLYSASNKSINDIVKNANIESWKNIANSIITFSTGKASFNSEMRLLGDRLLNSELENKRDFALSCFIASDSLDKVSQIWLSELSKYESYYLSNNNDDGFKNTAFEARFKALGEVIEKIVIFQSTSKFELSSDSSELGKIFVEYADSLVNYGHYELAYKLLNMVSDSIPEIKIEKNRISKAFIQNVSNNVTTNISNISNVKKPSVSKYVLPQTSAPDFASQQVSQPVQQQQDQPSVVSTSKASNKYAAKRNPYVLPATSPSLNSAPLAQAPPTRSNSIVPPPPPSNRSNSIVPPPPSSNRTNSIAASPSTTNIQQQQSYQTPVSAAAPSYNPYQPQINSFQAPANPYQPTNIISPNTSNTNLAASANPYAPKTALDSLKQPAFSPSNSFETKKENILPPSLRKDMGGWNDLPTHLAPVVKPTPAANIQQFQDKQIKALNASNEFPLAHNRSQSGTRVISQAPAMPTPPSKNVYDQNSSSSQSSLPTTPRIAATNKNPYAPKPEAFHPPTIPRPQSPMSRIASPLPGSMNKSVPPKPAIKNPYAPKANNNYLPETSQYQPQPQALQQQPQQFQFPPSANSFNANVAPPPPNYGKPQGSFSSAPPPPRRSSQAPPAFNKPQEELPITTPTNAQGVFPDQTLTSAAVLATPQADSVDLSFVQSIGSTLLSEIEKVKPKIPQKFEKQVIDTEKRVNILIKHLQAGDLLSQSGIAKLNEIVTALVDENGAKAKSLSEEFKAEFTNECGEWMPGVTRLIGMKEALKKK